MDKPNPFDGMYVSPEQEQIIIEFLAEHLVNEAEEALRVAREAIDEEEESEDLDRRERLRLEKEKDDEYYSSQRSNKGNKYIQESDRSKYNTYKRGRAFNPEGVEKLTKREYRKFYKRNPNYLCYIHDWVF